MYWGNNSIKEAGDMRDAVAIRSLKILGRHEALGTCSVIG